MSALKPAAELAAAASKPYPGDSADYRRARSALLAEEIELRSAVMIRGVRSCTATLCTARPDTGGCDLTPAGRGTDWYPEFG